MNTEYDKMIEGIDMSVDIDMGKIEQKNRDISKAVNRYLRIKRKRFFRKIFYLGFRCN